MYHKEISLVIETISFTTESLACQNTHLNGVRSTSEIIFLGIIQSKQNTLPSNLLTEICLNERKKRFASDRIFVVVYVKSI